MSATAESARVSRYIDFGVRRRDKRAHVWPKPNGRQHTQCPRSPNRLRQRSRSPPHLDPVLYHTMAPIWCFQSTAPPPSRDTGSTKRAHARHMYPSVHRFDDSRCTHDRGTRIATKGDRSRTSGFMIAETGSSCGTVCRWLWCHVTTARQSTQWHVGSEDKNG